MNWADYYRDWFSWKEFIRNLFAHSELIEEIILEKPKTILEVGTGTSSLSIFLSYFGYDIISVDNNEEILKNARNLCRNLKGNVEYILCDAFKLSRYFKGKFDVVFSQGFFEHFNDNQINHLLKEQVKVGKVILISVPSKYYPSRSFGDERLLRIKDWEKILENYLIEKINYYNYNVSIKKFFIDLIKYPYPPFKKPNHILIKLRVL
ncbi:MAG: class I SAM-dependent methyltransferase [Candidatus Methanospirare jalkutatii]|nr:class I SAM-dependent methyltransferase [Candidatus Methanospirare jalkutatii]